MLILRYAATILFVLSLCAPIEAEDVTADTFEETTVVLLKKIKEATLVDGFPNELRNDLIRQILVTEYDNPDDIELLNACQRFTNGELGLHTFVTFLQSQRPNWSKLYANFEELKEHMQSVGVDELLEALRTNESLSVNKELLHAIQLSRPVLLQDPDQLGIQLVARTIGTSQPELQQILPPTDSWIAVPKSVSLFQAGGPLVSQASAPGMVLSVAFAPDGRTYCVGTDSGKLLLFSADSGTLIRSFPRGSTPISKVCMDRKRLLAVSKNEVEIWLVGTGELARKHEFNDPIQDATLISDGSMWTAGFAKGAYLSGSNVSMELFVGKSRNVTAVCRASHPADSITITDEGTVERWFMDNKLGAFSISENKDRILAIESLSYGEKSQTLVAASPKVLYLCDSSKVLGNVWIGFDQQITSAAISEDGSVIAVGAEVTSDEASVHPKTGALLLFELKNAKVFPGGAKLRVIQESAPITSLSLCEDGTRLVYGMTSGDVKVLDLTKIEDIRKEQNENAFNLNYELPVDSNGIALRLLDDVLGPVTSIAQSANGKHHFLARAMTVSRRQGDLEQASILNNPSDVFHLASSPSGEHVAVETLNKSIVHRIKLFDRDWNEVEGYFGYDLYEFSPDGSTMLVVGGDDDGSGLRLISPTSGKTIQKFETRIRDKSFFAACFSSDGKYVACRGPRHTITLWSVATGKQVNEFRAFNDFVTQIDTSADDRFIAASCKNGLIRVFEASGALVRTFAGHLTVSAFSFSPSGRVIASAGARTLKLWLPESGHVLQTVTLDSPISSLAWKGDQLVVGDVSGVAHHYQIDPERLSDEWTRQHLPAEQNELERPDDQYAILRFHVQADRLRHSLLGVPQFETAASDVPKWILNINEIRGGISGPRVALDYQRGFRFDFLIEVRFDDKESLLKMKQELGMNRWPVVDWNGKRYHRVPHAGTMNKTILIPGTFVEESDETTLVFGSRQFLFREDRNVFSPRVDRAWEQISSGGITLAIDGTTDSILLPIVIDSIKELADSKWHTNIDSLHQLQTLTLSINLLSSTLAKIEIQTEDSNATRSLERAFNALAEEIENNENLKLFVGQVICRTSENKMSITVKKAQN